MVPFVIVFGTAMNNTDLAYRTVGRVFLGPGVILIAAGTVMLELAVNAMSKH